MRQERIWTALVLLIVASGLTVYWWDTVVDVDARHRKYDRIREGMTQAEVEAIMGEKGVPQPLKITGNWGEMWGFPSMVRWDDAYFTVDVRFFPGLTRGAQATVSHISRQPRSSDALAALWFQRVLLFSLWSLGVGILIRGLLTPKPVDALNSRPTSDTQDEADSPTA